MINNKLPLMGVKSHKYLKIGKNWWLTLIEYSNFYIIRNFDYLFLKGGNPK